MTTDDFVFRIKRLYSAIGLTIETDLRNVPARVFATDREYGVVQDFRGGMKLEQIVNFAYSAIHQIAAFEDNAKSWAVKNGQSKDAVGNLVRNSKHLLLIKDLDNADKHGYPPRNGGYSAKSPRLVNIDRVCQLRTGTQQNSSVMFSMGADGKAKTALNGGAGISVVIAGDVLDSTGSKIIDLNELLRRGLSEWEVFLTKLGIVC